MPIFCSIIRTGSSTLLDISISVPLEVQHQDMRQPDKNALSRATTQLYERFKASESQYVFERQQPAKSHDLQNLFYRKILEEEREGIHLYLPSKDGPPPAVFDLKGKKTRKGSSSAGEDSISISSSAIDEHIREQDGGLGVKSVDTLSISSNMSGNIGGGLIAHSASGMDLCGNDSNAEVDIDEEQAIYEDIEELCENMRKEAGEGGGGGGGGGTEGPEEQVKEFAAKKSSILSFLKKKTKGKKGKDKESSEAYVDVEFDGDGASSQQPSKAKEPAGVPEPIPTHSHSSSESYDEMGPSNAGYLSDNYEECAFGDGPLPPSPGADSTSPKAPEPPSKKRPALKPSLLAKAVVSELNEASAISPGESMDDLNLSKKKKKLKESMKRSGTLPRKMKLGSGEKKAPPIIEVSNFPLEAKVADISLTEQVWSLTNQVERLKAEMKELRSAVELLMAVQDTTGTNVEANLRVLKEMTLEQVCSILLDLVARLLLGVLTNAAYNINCCWFSSPQSRSIDCGVGLPMNARK